MEEDLIRASLQGLGLGDISIQDLYSPSIKTPGFTIFEEAKDVIGEADVPPYDDSMSSEEYFTLLVEDCHHIFFEAYDVVIAVDNGIIDGLQSDELISATEDLMEPQVQLFNLILDIQEGEITDPSKAEHQARALQENMRRAAQRIQQSVTPEI